MSFLPKYPKCKVSGVEWLDEVPYDDLFNGELTDNDKRAYLSQSEKA